MRTDPPPRRARSARLLVLRQAQDEAKSAFERTNDKAAIVSDRGLIVRNYYSYQFLVTVNVK
jgi:hypothetical protein